MNKPRTLLPFVLLCILAAGCSSLPLTIPNLAKSDYDVLGEGEGSATGIMLFQFIPIGQNTRFVRAYKAALKSKDGDALLEPVVQEKWFWAWVLNGYSTKITGTVIKYK
jgi:hypothetical protein